MQYMAQKIGCLESLTPGSQEKPGLYGLFGTLTLL